MKKMLPLIVLLGCLASGVHAEIEPPSACNGIRDQIQLVTGLVSTPNMELLQHISMHQECNFSSAEVYRAAYGDKHLPQPKPSDHENNRESEDD
jgi:hypothetical protein